MQFISIITFLNYCSIEINERKPLNLSRIKKQVNAEFSLAEDGFITIEDVNYNKQDVLAILDSKDFDSIIQYHQLIKNHLSLNDFLERGIADYGLIYDVEELMEDESFIRFVSPYFAPQFNKEMHRLLQEYNFEKAADFLLNCQLVWNTEGEIAFQSTTNFLNENIKLIRNLNSHSFQERKDEVKPWTGNWARLFNMLPDLVFALKEEFCIKLIDFCIEIQYTDQMTCYLISKRMIELNFLDTTLSEIIKRNHEIYEANVKNDHVPANVYRDRTSTGRTFWLPIVAILFACIRLIGTCNHSSSNSTNIINSELYDKIHKEMEAQKKKNDPMFRLIELCQIESPLSISKNSIHHSKNISAFNYVSLIVANKAEPSTFKIYNNCNQVFHLYMTNEGEIERKILLPYSALSFYKSGNNVDMILTSDSTSIQGIYNQKEIDKFFWTKNKNTSLELSYSNQSSISFNDSNIHNTIDIEIKEGKKGVYLYSEEIFLVEQIINK